MGGFASLQMFVFSFQCLKKTVCLSVLQEVLTLQLYLQAAWPRLCCSHTPSNILQKCQHLQTSAAKASKHLSFIPAMAAFVDATAGMILFTTPAEEQTDTGMSVMATVKPNSCELMCEMYQFHFKIKWLILPHLCLLI